MDNAPGSFPIRGGSEERERQIASSNALREALRALSANGGSGGASGGAGNLSPEMLADLAQRAGVPGGAADLARLFGQNPAGMAPESAPRGPQYVVFAVRDAQCCIPADAVQNVARFADVTPVPNTVDWVLGVVQLRGSIISVVDLPAYLGLPAIAATARSRLLVVGYRGMTIGFAVDAVLETRADSSGMHLGSDRTVPEWLAPYAAGALELGERQFVLLDVQRLLFADRMHQYRSDVA